MQFLVLLALLIQMSSSFHTSGNPYVYETHDSYHRGQSSRPLMILSPPQPRRSFQQVSFSSNLPAVQPLPVQQMQRFQQADSFGPIRSLPAQQMRQSFPPSTSFTPSKFVSSTFPPSPRFHNNNVQPIRSLPAPQPVFPSSPRFHNNNVQPQPIRSLPAPQPVFPPSSRFHNNNVQPQPILSLPAPQPVMSTQSSTFCDPNKPLIDETRNGFSYHFSWCHDGGESYTWENANLYCKRLGSGFQAVSIQDQGEDDFISNIVSHHPIRWIWTSGSKLHTTNWAWGDGSQVSYTNWSHTGGSGVPQPDNRENNNEKCLAVLKNFYRDGIKWHDIGCHHRKPVICEAFHAGRN